MEWNGDKIIQRIREAAMRGVVRGTEAVHTRAVQKVLSGPKSGAVYRRRGITHQASAPGESPASDTGRLAQSGRTSYDHDELIGTVTFSTKYAAYLELGTEKMEPRPFLRPALEEQRSAIQEAIAAEVRSVLR